MSYHYYCSVATSCVSPFTYFIHRPLFSLNKNRAPRTFNFTHIAIQQPVRPSFGGSITANTTLTTQMLVRFIMLGTKVSLAPTNIPDPTNDAAYNVSANASILRTFAPRAMT